MYIGVCRAKRVCRVRACGCMSGYKEACRGMKGCGGESYTKGNGHWDDPVIQGLGANQACLLTCDCSIK